MDDKNKDASTGACATPEADERTNHEAVTIDKETPPPVDKRKPLKACLCGMKILAGGVIVFPDPDDLEECKSADFRLAMARPNETEPGDFGESGVLLLEGHLTRDLTIEMMTPQEFAEKHAAGLNERFNGPPLRVELLNYDDDPSLSPLRKEVQALKQQLRALAGAANRHLLEPDSESAAVLSRQVRGACITLTDLLDHGGQHEH